MHLAEHPTEDLVFGSMHPSNFRQRVWNRAVEATVGRPCRFHDLRLSARGIDEALDEGLDKTRREHKSGR